MRLLVDTHVWLWLQNGPERVPPSVLALLEDPANPLLLSVASIWEISTKYHVGRLPLPEPPATYVPSRLTDGGFSLLDIEQAHALRAGELPRHHRDPFDRLLIAQSQILGVPLVTGDPEVVKYDVEVLWS
jgi:PIN domain nuclease of toxin-antitoxin system